jgi:hypothetical protein
MANDRGGRPAGACAQLAEAFLRALLDDFESGGCEAIEKVRSERPHDYLRLVAAVVPKESARADGEPAAAVRRRILVRPGD